ncbi:MAG: hypothetical protein M3R53_06665 [Candidatus Eremiobacteraeota bacterium]|nr:hypothetical protein [Candidatus Eremiobacteraeota bacterium]
MRRLRLARTFFAAWAALAAVLFSMVPALSATLANVRIDPQASGGALVAVSFTGGAPTYHVVGAGTAETSVLFDGATLGPQVSPSIAGAGPITSASVAQTGSSSSVALHLTGPNPVRVRVAGSIVLIDVSPLAGGALPNPFAAAGGAVGAAPGLGPVTVVVALKYADISEIAGVLFAGANIASNDTFTPMQTQLGASSLGGGSFGGIGGGGGFSQQQPVQTFGGGFGAQAVGLAQRVNDNIAVDRRLNAIILSGTPEVVAGLRAIIEKLDVPVQSVILETQIVELSDSAARNVGLDASPDGSGVVVNANGRSSSSTGASAGNGYTLGTGQLGSGAATLNALLYAQITQGNGRVIAKPRILAQSGQQASILTGDAIPILTNIAVQNVGTAAQVNYVNVGVNLQILPRVSSDGFVTSHIYSEVSSVTSFNPQGIPQISQRTANTTATVHDGDAFIIGGLLQDNELRNLSKIPFIGDLPLIGVFFRHVSTSHSQTNLYIVVTPHIVGGNTSASTVQPLVVPAPLPQVAPPPAPGKPSNSPGPLAPPKPSASPRSR